MKTSEEMVKSLFERREKYIEEKSKISKAAIIIGRVAAPVCCLAIIAAVLITLKGITETNGSADIVLSAGDDDYTEKSTFFETMGMTPISRDDLFALADKAEAGSLTASDLTRYDYREIGSGMFIIMLYYSDGQNGEIYELVAAFADVSDSPAVSVRLIRSSQPETTYLDFLANPSKLEDFLNGDYKDGAVIFPLKTDEYGNCRDTAANVLAYYLDPNPDKQVFIGGMAGDGFPFVNCCITAYDGVSDRTEEIYVECDEDIDISDCIIASDYYILPAFYTEPVTVFTLEDYPGMIAVICNNSFKLYEKFSSDPYITINGYSYHLACPYAEYAEGEVYEIGETVSEGADGSKVYYARSTQTGENAEDCCIIEAYMSEDYPSVWWFCDTAPLPLNAH